MKKKIVWFILFVLLLSLHTTAVIFAQEIIINLAEDKTVTYYGNWQESTAIPNYDGQKHLWATEKGDGFMAPIQVPEGNYEVFYYKIAHENSSANMQLVIYHNGKYSKPAEINQKQQPSGWVSLGVFDFKGLPDECVLHRVGIENTRASAIKLVPTDQPVTPLPETVFEPFSEQTDTKEPDEAEPNALPVDNQTYENEIIINAVQAPVILEQLWENSTAALNYDGKETKWSSTPGAAFTIPLSVEKEGNYKVYYYRAVHPNSASQMKFTISHNQKKDQTFYSVDLTKGESGWQLLGIYDFSSDTEQSLFHQVDAGNSRLTAVKLVPTTEALSPSLPVETPAEDTNDLDTYGLIPSSLFVQGDWQGSTLQTGIEGAQYTLWTDNDTVLTTAKWMPQIMQTGTFKIYIYKIVYGDNNDTNVEYTIKRGDEVLDVVYVDFSKGQTGWHELGEYAFSGNGDEYVELKRVSTGKENATRVTPMLFSLQNKDYQDNVTSSNFVVPVDADLTDYEEVQQLSQINYEDLKDHWAGDDVQVMIKQGYIKGISDTLFAPEETITRADFVTILTRMIADDMGNNDIPFTDIDPQMYYAPHVAFAYANNLLENFPVENQQFLPNQNITREEMALILANAIKYENKNMDWLDAQENIFERFTDQDQISAYALDAVEYVTKVGIIKGYTETTFEPQKNATRAEAAVMLKRFLREIIQTGPPTDREWELTFIDNFDGEDVNWEVWECENTAPGHILSSRWKENIEVEDGILKLISRKEERGGKEWTAASMWVKQSVFSQKYGYWEARYRYADAAGLNQSFWNFQDTYYEIDCNEGHWPNEVNTNLHQWIDGERKTNAETYKANEDLSKDFHTYAFEWNENEVIYYFDGQEIARKEIKIEEMPASSPMLSLAVVSWAGSLTDKIHNNSMDVDWVRVYRQKPAEE